MSRRAAVAVLLALAHVAGCASYRPNEALAPGGARKPYRFDELAVCDGNTDSLFVCVALSGGGTRAAAMAFGVLERLAATSVTWEGTTKPLLDEVDVISSVSGGSFAAAYLARFGKEAFLREFEERFLRRNIQGELVRRALCPVNLVRLASPWFDRIDLAAEHYDETIFGGSTFDDLPRRRPFVVLNATNMADAERFEFTQDELDLLGSDLGTFPLANAVAASSAYPGLLSPVRLRNYPDKPGKLPEPIAQAVRDGKDAHGNVVRASVLNRRRFTWGLNKLTYFAHTDEHPYLHLIDGGVADNLGLGYLDDVYRRGFLHRKLADGAVRRLVFIVVNARSETPSRIDRSESSPGTLSVLYETASAGVDNTSSQVADSARALLVGRQREQRDHEGFAAKLRRYAPTAPPLPPIAGAVEGISFIEVNLEDIADDGKRRRLLDTGTNYCLPDGRVRELIATSGDLLSANPEFRRLLDELKKGP